MDDRAHLKRVRFFESLNGAPESNEDSIKPQYLCFLLSLRHIITAAHPLPASVSVFSKPSLNVSGKSNRQYSHLSHLFFWCNTEAIRSTGAD